MHLPGSCQSEFTIECVEKSTTILRNIFGGILVVSGKVEAIFGKRRDAADASRKTVHEPCGLKPLGDKDLYSIAFSPIEAGIG